MKKIIIISLLFLVGCLDPELDFPSDTNVVVVEGWVTNEEKQHWIKISRTVGFNSSNQEEPITDATVSVLEGGITRSFNHHGQGIYFSDSFAGTELAIYRLNITLSSGEVIVSEGEALNPVPEIIEITTSTFERQNPETGEDEIIYYPVVSSLDPLEEENYYRYKGFRNGILLNEPDQLELLSDQFTNGQFLPHNISRFEYALGDEIRIELHSLSKSAYDFLELLKLQTTSLGSSSGTAPATLQGNLRYLDNDDLVLGFFGASAVQTGSIIVE